MVRWQLILQVIIISLHIRSMWETTVMHKQVSGWAVNFGPNFPESPFLELKTRKPPPPSPHFRKLQIWDDQSLLWNTPPFRKTSDLGWPKFTPEYPPFCKTSDLGWPKFTPEYPPPPPPISKNFRSGMTKVYSGIPPLPHPQWKLSESPSPRVSECRELLHVETLSNPDNYSLLAVKQYVLLAKPE